MSQITTHVLDTAKGTPAPGIPLTLKHLNNGVWVKLAESTTNEDGRVPNLITSNNPLTAGTYCMRFETEAYLIESSGTCFYPWVEVVFNLNGSGDHFHIPLLLSPFGYSTYRGS